MALQSSDRDLVMVLLVPTGCGLLSGSGPRKIDHAFARWLEASPAWNGVVWRST